MERLKRWGFERARQTQMETAKGWLMGFQMVKQKAKQRLMVILMDLRWHSVIGSGWLKEKLMDWPKG